MTTSPSLDVLVARKSREAPDICSLELVGVGGQPLPAFTAGSHVDLHLPNGVVRQYSLCNSPADSGRYRIAVLRDAESRGGSLAVHDLLEEGARLKISVPRNHFELAAAARRSLLVAGGIGITPLLSMAEHLSARKADFALHYCTRTRERTAFCQHIEASPFASRVHFHHSAEGRADLEALLAQPSSELHLYTCGPQKFMTAVIETARRLGWSDGNVHHEYFSASVTALESDAEFNVKLARSGRVIPIPAACTVAQALLDAGVELNTSCEQGVCGTCLTRVIEGEPDHRDMYLSPDEQARNDCFLPCCSRSLSPRLVLDL